MKSLIPSFAKRSTQKLLSRWACWNLASSKYWIRDLQSFIKALQGCESVIPSFTGLSKSTTDLASISIISLQIWRSRAKSSPSLSLHNSTTKELAIPSLCEKPRIQLPLLSLKIPPTLACLGFPSTKPSVFSLIKPEGGGFRV